MYALASFSFFDNESITIRPEHVMASGALPPGFPTVEIDGEHYWDGALVSNTPLQYVLDYLPRRSRISFQVDLFHAHGRVSTNSCRRSCVLDEYLDMTLGRPHQVDLKPRPHDWARFHENSAANAGLLTSHRAAVATSLS
jgi:predicted acylesterase/phospholipase RssA